MNVRDQIAGADTIPNASTRQHVLRSGKLSNDLFHTNVFVYTLGLNTALGVKGQATLDSQRCLFCQSISFVQLLSFLTFSASSSEHPLIFP